MAKLKATAAAIAAAGMMFAAGLTSAKEGGDQYPNGVEGWLAGAVPPPGNYFLNYFGYYSGDLRDGSGNKTSFPGTGNNGSVSAWFDALRFLKTTGYQIFGANYGFHAIVPLVHQQLDLGAPNGSRTVSGFGDVTLSPLVLSWHTPEWHWAAALDIFMPWGKYDKNDGRGSIGANYYSYEPVFAVTYLGPTGWEVSAKFMYNFKDKNKDANFLGTDGTYESGDEFHMDYTVGKRFGPWGVGLAGYYLKQTNDDKFNGASVPPVPGLWSQGRRGEVFAIGPSVIYQAEKSPIFIGTWHHETTAENRFRGDKFLFKLILPF